MSQKGNLKKEMDQKDRKEELMRRVSLQLRKEKMKVLRREKMWKIKRS